MSAVGFGFKPRAARLKGLFALIFGRVVRFHRLQRRGPGPDWAMQNPSVLTTLATRKTTRFGQRDAKCNAAGAMHRVAWALQTAKGTGHDAFTRCEPAGSRSYTASSHCTWSALGSVTRLALPSRVTCSLPRMILQKLLA